MQQSNFKRWISLILLAAPLFGCEKTIWPPEKLMPELEGVYHYAGTLDEWEDTILVTASEADAFELNFAKSPKDRFWIYLDFYGQNALLKKMTLVDFEYIVDPIHQEMSGVIYYDQFGHQIVLYSVGKDHFAPTSIVLDWFAIKDFPYSGRNVFYCYK